MHFYLVLHIILSRLLLNVFKSSLEIFNRVSLSCCLDHYFWQIYFDLNFFFISQESFFGSLMIFEKSLFVTKRTIRNNQILRARQKRLHHWGWATVFQRIDLSLINLKIHLKILRDLFLRPDKREVVTSAIK